MGVISNGTTLLDAGALDSGIATGAMTLLSTATASSSATLSFTSGISSTYKEYQFHFTDIHPATNDTALTFQTDTGTNTSYNQTMTTTRFKAGQNEAGNYSVLSYSTGSDQAQGTGYQTISENMGNENDESGNGTLHLYDPSNTTFVKHFVANNQEASRNINDAIISDRALREIYLKGFEIIVKKSQPWAIMSSYNKINGTYVAESKDILTDILRGEWDFQGLVMTDWFGGNSAPLSIAAGNDLLEPGTLSLIHI